eukprot:Rhum_TRINITY_DN17893_c0_g1::Rhum_TRINITY_DN17893_c0_g1_i1::g.166655::m.166655
MSQMVGSAPLHSPSKTYAVRKTSGSFKASPERSVSRSGTEGSAAGGGALAGIINRSPCREAVFQRAPLARVALILGCLILLRSLQGLHDPLYDAGAAAPSRPVAFRSFNHSSSRVVSLPPAALGQAEDKPHRGGAEAHGGGALRRDGLDIPPSLKPPQSVPPGTTGPVVVAQTQQGRAAFASVADDDSALKDTKKLRD